MHGDFPCFRPRRIILGVALLCGHLQRRRRADERLAGRALCASIARRLRCRRGGTRPRNPQFHAQLEFWNPEPGRCSRRRRVLCTTWPKMVGQGRGRFLVLNLKGLTYQQWQEDPAWSLHRGLAALRGLPVPLWFLQLADQALSDWGSWAILPSHRTRRRAVRLDGRGTS